MQISQVLLPHETLPRSASSVIFNFERTNLSRYVFGLRKAICGGLGNTAFTSDFCTCRCAIFNTSKTIFNAAWNVNTRVILSSWCFGHFQGGCFCQLSLLSEFLVTWFQIWIPYLSTAILNVTVSVVNQIHLKKSVSCKLLGHTVLSIYKLIYGMM